MAGDHADNSDVHPSHTGGPNQREEGSQEEIGSEAPAGNDTMDIIEDPYAEMARRKLQEWVE